MSGQRRGRGQETITRLQDWSEHQKAAERLAGHILAADGFASLDPSHPLGGKDGLKDLCCTKDHLKWIVAVYFPRDQQNFVAIRKKFIADSAGIGKNYVDAFVFFTNQKVSVAERTKLAEAIQPSRLEVYHVERIASLLDRPHLYGTRLEFLDIAMTKEEQLSAFAMMANLQSAQSQLRDELAAKNAELLAATKYTIAFLSGGDSYCKLIVSDMGSNVGLMALFPCGEFPVYDLSVRIVNVRNFNAQLRSANGPLTLQQATSGDENYDVHILVPGTSRLLRQLQVPPEGVDLNIYYVARNGSFTQMLRVRRVNGKLRSATKILRYAKGTNSVVVEEFNEGFPLDPSGSVSW